ncbi:MAG TPA: VCBS repeat-containing protein [Saprospiraceae bacterium]|nr:VCBS repeat-containing protein [Saprospiraceae bacterium]HMQ82677.1 VCBS repeat-containing protein [Saprospiraceae bacterium]
MQLRGHLFLMIFTGLIGFSACKKDADSQLKDTKSSTQFERLDARQTGIVFANKLTESEALNVLSYEYFYNGGGVAIGDINNDGLPDLFFSGNMVSNALYLNKGDLRFEDITEKAGLKGRAGAWKTGVSMVDINADGWLDIYLCYSGEGADDMRRNELYLNQGDMTFQENAAACGLDDYAHTTHSLFFDYDRDGDLDCYLLNHSTQNFQNFDATFVKKMEDPLAGDKLLRNDGGHFQDVTKAARIKNNPLGFGLGIAASDLNGDGWLDLYVSNDYIEEDYLYINQGNGTFQEELRDRIGHIPNFSMGSDIADFNNDGWTDVMALDMLPEDNRRQKLLYGPDEYEKYQSMLRNGFYHQVMRNMLQLNNGDGTFSEIGQLAGVSNTDWSWSALFADFDNDGWKDLFVSNGYLRDYTNRDFMSYYADQRIREVRKEPSAALMEIIAKMESTKTKNYIFRNNRDLSFQKMTEAWGFDDLLLTNGAAYADLDQDGDLDLVLNNVNEPACVYENRSPKGNYLQVRLSMPNTSNKNGIGARVELHYNDQINVQEFLPNRGFQSSMHVPLHFGLGDATQVAEIRITWPDGQVQSLQNVAANQLLNIEQQAGKQAPRKPSIGLYRELAESLNFSHRENPVVDFKRQALLPQMYSTEGPALATGDVNGDGLEDVFIGGAKLQAGELFLRTASGHFQRSEQAALKQDMIAEDVDATFFDADGDGDLDLYVVSGGYDYLPKDLALQDRLYLNNGTGQFTRVKEALPAMPSSGACVAIADFNADGAKDIFVGGRLVPGAYPETPDSYLLLNDGKGVFKNVTQEIAPELEKAGMITDALWLEDEQTLVLAGDWMPLRFFTLSAGRLTENSGRALETPSRGWWLSLASGDLDGDGDQDIVAGNKGLNHQMKVSSEEPARLYAGDYDGNAAIDPILTYYIQGKSYPAVSRDELLVQLPGMKKQFNDYASYAGATIETILGESVLANQKPLIAELAQTGWLENKGNGKWEWHDLPLLAQASPVYAILIIDANEDGQQDILLAGNLERVRANHGRMDANYGQLLLNQGQGQWKYLPQWESGFHITGDVRALAALGSQIIVARNNASALLYQK